MTVPTLCQFDGLEPWGGCRLCVVDLWRPGWDDDWFKMVTACNHPVAEGMTKLVVEAFEVVHVDHHQREGFAVSCRAIHLFRQPLLEVPNRDTGGNGHDQGARGKPGLDLGKGLFRCFHPHCEAQGNTLDLWAAYHRLPIGQAAHSLAETFAPGLTSPEKPVTEKRNP